MQKNWIFHGYKHISDIIISLDCMLRVTDSVSSAMKYTAIFLYDHFSIYSIIMQPLSA